MSQSSSTGERVSVVIGLESFRSVMTATLRVTCDHEIARTTVTTRSPGGNISVIKHCASTRLNRLLVLIKSIIAPSHIVMGD